MGASSESEVLAQELSNIAGQIRALEARVKDVEAVIEGLEGTVYRAMRRAE